MTPQEKLEIAIKSLEYYADRTNWEYTDCGGQFSWNTQIKDDIYLSPEVDEGGGTDYAGKHAIEALKLIDAGGSMTDYIDPKQETPADENESQNKGTDIRVPVLNMPSREEVKSILKTGKGLDGTPVHPQSREDLRKATIADLKAFGKEVNIANAALNDKLNRIIDEMDLAVKEIHWNFANLLSFLGAEGILKEGALEKFEAFKVESEKEMQKAAEFVLKQREDAAKGTPPAPVIDIVTPEPA